MKNIAILGGSGAVGGAFTKLLAGVYPEARISSFSRTFENTNEDNISYLKVNWALDESMAKAADLISKEDPIDLVLVTNGILCEGDITPEKSLKDLSVHKFQRLFEINTILPAMIAKYFVPKLCKQSRSIFAALSARVGSISDNRMGGWYAYRASKAALNMIIKNIAIETARKNKNAIIVGLHPGTVDSHLSKPFQSNVSPNKLFTPEYAASCLLNVLDGLTPLQTGKIFAWDGQEIDP